VLEVRAVCQQEPGVGSDDMHHLQSLVEREREREREREGEREGESEGEREAGNCYTTHTHCKNRQAFQPPLGMDMVILTGF